MPTRIETTVYTLADVKHITFGQSPREGVVTGVIVGQDDKTTLVKLYSAGCLHDVYVVPTPEIIKVEGY